MVSPMSVGTDGGRCADCPMSEILGGERSPDVIEVRMEADRPQQVLEQLCSFAADRFPDEDTMYKLRLVCDELLTNIAEYAYQDGNGPVYAAVDAREGLRAIIMDKGVEFNPLEDAADPDLDVPLEERSIGGVGIMLSKRVTKSLEYRRVGDWNVTIAVIKRGAG